MSAFNHHNLVRAIPAATWQPYFSAPRFADYLPQDYDWSRTEAAIQGDLIGMVSTLESHRPLQAEVLTELRHVHELGCRKGIDAMLNASQDNETVREDFEKLRNHFERALWVLINWPQAFQKARDFLRFDLDRGGRSWKRQSIDIHEALSRDSDDIAQLEGALAQLFSRKKGPRRGCKVDISDRYLDGGEQITIYVEDDPDDQVEFDDKGMSRKIHRPADEYALVYYRATGIVDCIGRGGGKTLISLVQHCARHLLHREVKPKAIGQPMFYLNRLRGGFETFDYDMSAFRDKFGISDIRLRSARVRSTENAICDYWVDIPARVKKGCAFSANSEHLKQHDFFRGAFNLIEAVIVVERLPALPDGVEHVFVLELKQSGWSNLRNLDEPDALLAETLLGIWNIVDMPATAVARDEMADAVA